MNASVQSLSTLVVEAARCVQKQDDWKDIEGVKSLVFSSNWV